MKIGKRTWYEKVLKIPEATQGAFRIRHIHKATGEGVWASSGRTAIFRGQTTPDLRYDHPTVWHELLEDDSRWMSDLPIEQIQIDDELQGLNGHVLVGGLGLGYAAVALAKKQRVKSITVVELEQDVIDLVAPHIAHRKITVVQGDLLAYLRVTPPDAFDWAFYDIWGSDGEHTFHTVVMPLRALSRGKVGAVRCWNEQVMRGQLAMGLQHRLYTLQMAPGASLDQLATGLPEHEQGAVYVNWARPFWQWVRDAKPATGLAEQVGVYYARHYGISDVDPAILAESLR